MRRMCNSYSATGFSPGQQLAFDEALFALVRFQLEEPSFHPYNSKYDAYLAGKAELSDSETRGLKLFEDPREGNCASCHVDKLSLDGRSRRRSQTTNSRP